MASIVETITVAVPIDNSRNDLVIVPVQYGIVRTIETIVTLIAVVVMIVGHETVMYGTSVEHVTVIWSEKMIAETIGGLENVLFQ